MNRLTEKGKRIRLVHDYLQTPSKERIIEAQRYNKLAELEDLMEKYEINSIEALEEIIKDYDDMCKDVVEMGLGVKVEIEDKSE